MRIKKRKILEGVDRKNVSTFQRVFHNAMSDLMDEFKGIGIDTDDLDFKHDLEDQMEDFLDAYFDGKEYKKAYYGESLNEMARMPDRINPKLQKGTKVKLSPKAFKSYGNDSVSISDGLLDLKGKVGTVKGYDVDWVPEKMILIRVDFDGKEWNFGPQDLVVVEEESLLTEKKLYENAEDIFPYEDWYEAVYNALWDVAKKWEAPDEMIEDVCSYYASEWIGYFGGPYPSWKDTKWAKMDESLKESYAVVRYWDNKGYLKNKIVNGSSSKDVEKKVSKLVDKYDVYDIDIASKDVADSEYFKDVGLEVHKKDLLGTRFDKPDRFEESLLTEKQWKHQLSNGMEIRQAIEDEDYHALRKALLAAYSEIHDMMPDEFDDKDYDDAMSEIDLLDTKPDEDADITAEDLEDNWNYELSDFYDLCDALDIWIPLNESLDSRKNLKESAGDDIRVVASYKNRDIEDDYQRNSYYDISYYVNGKYGGNIGTVCEYDLYDVDEDGNTFNDGVLGTEFITEPSETDEAFGPAFDKFWGDNGYCAEDVAEWIERQMRNGNIVPVINESLTEDTDGDALDEINDKFIGAYDNDEPYDDDYEEEEVTEYDT